MAFYIKIAGDGPSIAEIMYKSFRCNLVHEAELSKTVRLAMSKNVGAKLVGDFSGMGTIDFPIEVPDFMVLHLIKAVAEAPENATECADILARLK